MTEVIVPVLAIHYIVIASICWFAFMHTTTWQGGEDLFRFSTSPALPAISFWLGIVFIASVICALISSWIGSGRYSIRQRLSFSAACLILLVGLAVVTHTPVAFQSWLDSIQPAG